MESSVSVKLLPLGRTLTVPAGTALSEVLFSEGVEFPCGGRGRCRGCRVRVLQGELPVTEPDRQHLSAEALAEGWRLACQAQAGGDLELELAQWEARILADERSFQFTPSNGTGVAIDLGTTTVVAQLLDLGTGEVLGVRSALNEQARHGADVMSRIDHAVQGSGATALTTEIRRQIGDLIQELLGDQAGRASELRHVILVGNTVMHHLFCGLDVTPLAHTPFESHALGYQRLAPSELGWSLGEGVLVHFLPCLGGFVGSDLLAGILALRLHACERPTALLDLGTNGEILLGHKGGILCAGTAAGPAFEGARISMGMRAATGAIHRVSASADGVRCDVIGSGAARGICGSGLVDAAAVGLETGSIEASGRLGDRAGWELAPAVRLVQQDLRELQLAKGAIAAGLRLLARQWGVGLEEIDGLYLAGAFGNYISRVSAQRIGLLPRRMSQVIPAGNTALLGAKVALFSADHADFTYPDVLSRVRHVSLHEDPVFQEVYVEEMGFPAA